MSVLTEQQRLYLQTIFDHFQREGEWPSYQRLRRLLVGRIAGTVGDLAASLPPGFTNAGAHWQHDAVAIVTVPAIHLCAGSEEDLAAFLNTLHLCLERHFDSTNLDLPRIAAGDLRDVLRLAPLQARKVYRLLQVEPLITGSGGGGDDNWDYQITEEIGRYRDVRTIDDYLARRPMPGIARETAGFASLGGALVAGTPPRAVAHGLTALIADEELRRRCADLLLAERDYDRVVREACVVLEDRVRGAIGAAPELVGTALMEQAFGLRVGLLRLSTVDSEQVGAMQLYRSVIAFFRNRAGHRLVPEYTREDVLRFVVWVDLLLALVPAAREIRPADETDAGAAEGGRTAVQGGD